jgi:hypothetical protein
MKRVRLLSIALGFIAALLVGQNAFADELWSGSTRITALYPATYGMNFNTVYANTSLSTCDSGTRFFIEPTHSNYDAMVAAVIAAFISGKNVNLNITVNPPRCEGVVNRFVVYE